MKAKAKKGEGFLEGNAGEAQNEEGEIMFKDQAQDIKEGADEEEEDQNPEDSYEMELEEQKVYDEYKIQFDQLNQ